MFNSYPVILLLTATFTISIQASTYSINNTPLLLYKIINHWNITPQNDYNKPCAQSVKAQLLEELKNLYDPNIKRLTILIEGGFANLLSPFNEKEPSNYFKSIWINTKYFKKVDSIIKPNKNGKIEKIIFNNISKDEAVNFNHIKLTLEGTIYGLFSNSNKIALHNNGDFLKKCTNVKNAPLPSFSIKNNKTDEILIKYILSFK